MSLKVCWGRIERYSSFTCKVLELKVTENS